jgi:hypothetical protein
MVILVRLHKDFSTINVHKKTEQKINQTALTLKSSALQWLGM